MACEKLSEQTTDVLQPINLFSTLSRRTGYLFLFIICLTLSACSDIENSKNTISWTLDRPDDVGGFQPEILGEPELLSDETGAALAFDGNEDGLIIPVNPLENWEQFTVEVFFNPDSDGPEEQRFVHFQDENQNRGLLEIRINPDGRWSLDTFLYNKTTDQGLTLLDRTLDHPGDEWHWAALVYDGTTMSHYVNGIKELEGDIAFGPMGPGKISLGVRLNRVYWFKGQIRKILFHPTALTGRDLQLPE